MLQLSSLCLGLTSLQRHALAEMQYAADPNVIRKWMDEWIRLDRKPVGPLHVGRFRDRMYFLLRPIRWEPNPNQSGYKAVTVPAGFTTDFASIPQVFWSLLPPDGEYTYPAIVHDYLYWSQAGSKEDADSIFQFGMEDFSVAAPTISAIYNAVRLFGKTAWDEDARLKAAGEKRVLCRYPDNPTTTWDEWKKTPGVFDGCSSDAK
ncbi:DUF1353 domain-containing protein [Bradyrhizobium sp. CB82]|uniref:DUF1353 domain-containing protein n=1 Tax=Bradyrhizobium sp. CB82 TaxID=3039159 RepID=UPI0024B1D36F|nr:DUF1353 domain-containing protein [Bradyrhizobium sp. CB82]WFU40133.1 DUF1353 domain-containing protein [Bradyrhizobium sp. CB82]